MANYKMSPYEMDEICERDLKEIEKLKEIKETLQKDLNAFRSSLYKTDNFDKYFSDVSTKLDEVIEKYEEFVHSVKVRRSQFTEPDY